MRTGILSLVGAAGLIILFSTIDFRAGVFRPFGVIGTQYPGDSGLVLPGGGAADMAEVTSRIELGGSETPEPSEPEESVEGEARIEAEMEVKPNMEYLILAFWHGVVAVLVGEAAAIVIVEAYLKFKKSGDKPESITK